MKEVNVYIPKYSNDEIPLYLNTASAGATGFPFPANNYLEEKLDLNKYFNTKQHSTFYCRVSGNSMIDAGISNKDLLVVDRSLSINDNDIVVCVLEGELLVKRIERKVDSFYLTSANKKFKPVRIPDGDESIIWGVVVGVVKRVRG